MTDTQINDRLTMRIIDVIKTEIAKSETQQKLKCVVDPLMTYLVGVVQPYILIIVIIIFITLILQGYMVHKLWILQRSIKS